MLMKEALSLLDVQPEARLLMTLIAMKAKKLTDLLADGPAQRPRLSDHADLESCHAL